MKGLALPVVARNPRADSSLVVSVPQARFNALSTLSSPPSSRTGPAASTASLTVGVPRNTLVIFTSSVYPPRKTSASVEFWNFFASGKISDNFVLFM